MKNCNKCNQEKPLTSFYKKKDTRDGLKTYCKTCCAEANAEYYLNNKAAMNAHSAEYNRNNKAALGVYKAEYLKDPVNHLRKLAVTSFSGGLKKATEFNDGIKPVISAEEKELMLSFMAATKELSTRTGIAYEVDHIIPLSKGGQHSLANLQCITAADNRAKYDKIDFTDYTQPPSFPRPEDIAACEQTTPSEVAA